MCVETKIKCYNLFLVVYSVLPAVFTPNSSQTLLTFIINSHECIGINGEALQLHATYKKLYFLLHVMRESVSGTTSHVRCV